MPKRIAELHDPELLPGGTDNHTHFAGADPVVDSNLLDLDGDLLVGRVFWSD
jgi:hypothetical protein